MKTAGHADSSASSHGVYAQARLDVSRHGYDVQFYARAVATCRTASAAVKCSVFAASPAAVSISTELTNSKAMRSYPGCGGGSEASVRLGDRATLAA